MLNKQPWIRYAPHLMDEYNTCLQEGRDVEGYLPKVTEIKAAPDNAEELAAELGYAMTHAPIRSDFTYVEPSDLEGIRAQRMGTVVLPENTLTSEEWEDKLKGAWIGRIAGCLLGKPVECIRFANLTDILKTTNNYPMTRYITSDQFTEELCERSAWPLRNPSCWADQLQGSAPIDDDTNYPVIALRLMREKGWNFTSDDVMEMWMTYIPYIQVCTAERVAYRNAAMGMLTPQTATHQNPFREMIGARIRGDFFGFVAPGEPEKAAELGFRDACISHVKNGIYGEMYVCAMIASAAVCNDIETVIESGLSQIPHNSRHYESMKKVISWYKEGLTAEEAINKIHTIYNENSFHDWCDTISNDMIVTAALLYGQGDFGRSIGLAVQAAFDTDCNGATVGSILGIMCGKKGIDPAWITPWQEKLNTAILDYNMVTVDELTQWTIEVMNKR